MQKVPSISLAAGLAVGVLSPVMADPAHLAAPPAAGGITDLRTDAAPITLTTPRGDHPFAGEFVTMRDELENFPLDTAFGSPGVSAPPTAFTGPPGFVWPLNRLRGQPDGSINTGWVRIVDLSSDPGGGANGVINSSKALRIRTISAQSPNGFYEGAGLSFGGNGSDISTLPLEPLPGMNARVSAEHWLSSIDSLYTFEPVATFTGFITGRLMWGGTCVSTPQRTCSSVGLPNGAITHFYYLAPSCTFELRDWTLASYCENQCGSPIPGCVPPPGYSIGDPVAPPLQNWFRLAAETTADGRVNFLFDPLDGTAETAIGSHYITSTPYIDRVAWNSSYEGQDSFMLVDNIEASGPIFQMADPPPLDCPYLDDLEWLPNQFLRGQSTRWIVENGASPRVVEDGSHGRIIRHFNESPNSRYRRQFGTSLPPSSATVSHDLLATVKARTTGSTVRGFGLFNDAQLAARVFLGRDDGSFASGWFTPRVYVQTNPEYDPIDVAGGDHYLNIPVIGVDVADTGHDWQAYGAYKTLELRLSANGALRVSIDGQRIYAGPGAFAGALDGFAFESENNTLGAGASLRINDVTFACDAASCATDFDFDDAVTFADLNAVLANFGATDLTGFNPGDANGDGAINFTDLNAVLVAFGTACD